MKAYVTRDSVCAADDLDPPHARRISIPEGLSVKLIVERIWREAGVPRIATWCIASNVPLAVVSEPWDQPRFLPSMPSDVSQLDGNGSTLRFHITCYAQEDPEVVFSVLSQLRLKAQ